MIEILKLVLVDVVISTGKKILEEIKEEVMGDTKERKNTHER